MMAISSLPNELFCEIVSLLPQKDIKNLRLVSRNLNAKAKLRITRIFLSPNRTNTDVFRNIANSEEYKKGVEEIVWDDARFTVFHDGPSQHVPEAELIVDGVRGPEPKFFEDFVEEAGIFGTIANTTPEQSFQIYQDLYKEQQAIIESGEDVETLRMGLLTLPALKRVTITSECWRPEFTSSLYKTPLIRSLPQGFRCPTPYPWLGSNSEVDDDQGERDAEKLVEPWEQEPCSEWRGWHFIISELLTTAARHKVSELIVDVHREPTGIVFQLFNSPNGSYGNMLQLFDALPLTRLDLAIHISPGNADDFACFRNGLLNEAVSKLTHLKYLALHTSLPTNCFPGIDGDNPWISLQDIFSDPHANSLPHLEHLGLANFFTLEDSLYLLLSNLRSLRTVDLDTIVFKKNSGTYRNLLEDLKIKMVESKDGPWTATQPQFTIRSLLMYSTTRGITIDCEIIDYLYRAGECPFREAEPNFIACGFGWVLDDFNETYRVPHIYPSSELNKYQGTGSVLGGEMDDYGEELAGEEEE